MNTASWIGAAALVLATVCGTAFMIIYSRRGPWWRPDRSDPHADTRAHLGYFTLALTVTFWVYDFRPVIPPAVFAWVRALLFLIIALCMAWRLALAVRAKHRAV